MTLYFPDLNVWLALSVDRHAHYQEAWNWLTHLPDDAQLIFSRYTQIGFLRLLTNPAAMSNQVLALDKAWTAYDRWLADPRVTFYPEPAAIDTEFRRFTAPFGAKAASKWVGDCWLLAFAQSAQASLITFDKALHDFARKHGHTAVIPA